MTAFAPLAVAVALFAPPADAVTTAMTLRNVAAADAVQAVGEFARGKRLRVVADAVSMSNTVRLTGPAADHGKVIELLAAIDRPAPQVVVECLMLEGPAGFPVAGGLCVEHERHWAYAPRDARLLNHAVRALKDAGQVDVLSRPQLTIVDNQTGYFMVGSADQGLTLQVVPRLAADGTALMRVQTFVRTAAGQSSGTVVGVVTDGGGLAFRVARPGDREVVVFATATRVAVASR